MKATVLTGLLILLPLGVPAQSAPAVPRLTGIINLPDSKCVVIEAAASPFNAKQWVAKEGQKDWGVELLEIWPKNGTARVKLDGRDTPVSLELSAETKSPGGEIPAVALDNAGLNPVLELYGNFSGRTVLRSPLLPDAKLSLRASPTNRTEAARVLERALAGKEISVLPDGNKFVLVVPRSQAATVVPRSSQIKNAATNSANGVATPSGSIDFRGVSLVQALAFYAHLIGSKLDPDPRQILSPGMDSQLYLHAETPLMREECIYALDTLFSWHGIKVTTGTDGFIKVTPTAEVKR